MDVQTFQLFEDATLDLKIQSLFRNVLSELNGMLIFLENRYPKILEDFIMVLIKEFSKEESFNHIVNDFSFEILDKYPELQKHSINKILSLLNYKKYNQPSVSEQIEISVDDAIKARFIFFCYVMDSITKTTAFEGGIEVIKQLVDNNTKSYENPEQYFDSMRDYFENSWISFFKTWKTHDAVIGMPDEHTIICKITKCRWYNIMKEMDLNPEVMYATICYSDFQQRKTSNPGFLLTRTKTLVEGDELCDFCDHDTRFKEEIEHPTQEIWDSL